MQQDQVASGEGPNARYDELRQIFMAGHSVKKDLGILQAKGLDSIKAAHIVAILDTHSLSRLVFASRHKAYQLSHPLRTLTDVGRASQNWIVAIPIA